MCAARSAGRSSNRRNAICAAELRQVIGRLDRRTDDALVQIERTRVQIQETLLELRLDEARRLADLDALTAVRLAGAD